MRAPRYLRLTVGAVAIGMAMVPGACSLRQPPEKWESVPIPTDADFRGMWFCDSLRGWITGGGWAIPGGIVGRTRDGGRSWRFQSGVVPQAGDRFGLHDVQFQDSLRGCVVGDHGAILLTEDGGENWRRASRPHTGGTGLFDVQFFDADHGWAIGSARILQTEDGGETWRLLIRSVLENDYLGGNAIHFVDRFHGWLAGRDGRLMRSEDGGRTWTPVVLPLRESEHPTLWDITFTDPSHGWVVGDEGAIFHSDDGGQTWARQENGVPIERVLPKGEPPRPRDVLPELEVPPSRLSISAVCFVDPSLGWAVGYYADVAESVILGTSDGGQSWEIERVQPGELLRSLFALDATHAWAAGDRARTQSQVVLRYTAARSLAPSGDD